MYNYILITQFTIVCIGGYLRAYAWPHIALLACCEGETLTRKISFPHNCSLTSSKYAIQFAEAEKYHERGIRYTL